jgi:ubiquinone/menaquinone biosynthesis C-methylase UbiE
VHWTNIDPERLARYETMYQWSAAAEAFYTAAEIGEGQAVADFGCGPGHTAIEFACRVGASGHVHALDVNAEFIKRTQARAEAAGLADRITTHLLTSERLPLADATLDRITIIYVRDPVATPEEFPRMLKPGGLAHAIESDWSLTAVEPLGSEWRALGAARGRRVLVRRLRRRTRTGWRSFAARPLGLGKADRANLNALMKQRPNLEADVDGRLAVSCLL